MSLLVLSSPLKLPSNKLECFNGSNACKVMSVGKPKGSLIGLALALLARPDYNRHFGMLTELNF